MSTPTEIRPLEPIAADQLDAATGGAFNWGSLAQSVLGNVAGQVGGPAGNILGMFTGMLGKLGGGGAPTGGAAPTGEPG
ncbi:MAG: hypothetical protein KBG48_24495 [Kofleriaceae bacterium]|jgi:hypothetical protein|nr:hypothetical protein [Kofleriaceae bacterium]MBP9170585.1 hypothetical protein [Kofleriaceae bacterium]MBP9863063.1 hypothetical protein [Kofleriaceae bacterium]